MENIGNQLLRWQKLIQRTANKVRSITIAFIFIKIQERIREVAKNMRNVIPKLIPKKRDDQTQSVDLIGFHYNGHDVPRPTENGEIWVFSENMDQVGFHFTLPSIHSFIHTKDVRTVCSEMVRSLVLIIQHSFITQSEHR